MPCVLSSEQLEEKELDLAQAEGKVVALATGTERIHGQFLPLQTKLLEAVSHLRGIRNLLPFLDKEAQEVKDNAKAIEDIQAWLNTTGDINTNIAIVNQANKELRVKFPALGKRIMQHEANGAPTKEFVEWRERDSDDLGKLFETSDLGLDSQGDLLVAEYPDVE